LPASAPPRLKLEALTVTGLALPTFLSAKLAVPLPTRLTVTTSLPSAVAPGVPLSVAPSSPL
jgi:hypothetical protein